MQKEHYLALLHQQTLPLAIFLHHTTQYTTSGLLHEAMPTNYAHVHKAYSVHMHIPSESEGILFKPNC